MSDICYNRPIYKPRLAELEGQMSQQKADHPQDIPVSRQPPKKSYHTPHLEVAGNVREMTLTSANGTASDGGGNPSYISAP